MSKLKKKEIDPRAYYTLQDIVRDKYFPYQGSFYSVRKAVEADRKKENILNPKVTGKGRGKKYHFKGENIIKFVDKH